MAVTEAQIRHIEEHQQEFNELTNMGYHRDVRLYLTHEYGDDPNTYLYVCSDLGLEPIKEDG